MARHDSCHEADREAGRRVLLPRREGPGPALRRGLLHRGADHRHLLPALLPGPHAGVPKRHVPPECRLSAGGWLPRVQALPPRRHARQPRLGRRGRRGRPGDAPDRRRRRRPGGCPRPGPSGRLHAPSPEPDPHRGGRRRSARARPRPPGPDGARADRDEQLLPGRCRVRRGLLQRPAVQRDDPRGLRRDADRAARASQRRPGDRHDVHAPRGPDAVRRTGAAAVPGRPRRPGSRGGGRGLVRPDPGPAPRHGHGAPRRPRRPDRRRDGVRPGHVRAAKTSATPRPPSSARGACWTPTATPSPWPTRSPATP